MNKTRSTGQERETERKRKKIGGKMDRESGGGDVKERVREIQRERDCTEEVLCMCDEEGNSMPILFPHNYCNRNGSKDR